MPDRREEQKSGTSGGEMLDHFGGKDEQYEQSFGKLYAYREKLYKQLGKPNFDLEKYQQFQLDFREKLDEAREFLREYRRTDGSAMANNNNDPLVAEVMIRYRSKLLLQLFHTANRSVRMVDNGVAAIERDFQKKSKSLSLEQIVSVRQNYSQILNVFNVLIQIEIRPDTKLYRYFYDYIQETKENLTELFKKLFEWSFTLVRWPCIALESSDSKPDDQNLQLFQELIRFLLELENGDFPLSSNESGDVTGKEKKKNLIKELPLFKHDDNDPSLVMRLMVEPLIKRFRFHFLSPNSKLNNIENPEWYLCQVEQWITRNEPFLEQYVDPIFQEYSRNSNPDNRLRFRSAKYQLIGQLLEIVKVKLKQDSINLIDDRIFSLTLDEVIIFNKQIAFIEPEIYENEPNLNPLSVFFDDPVYYDRFVQIERTKLNEFIESIFESETSWSLIYGTTEENNKFIICEAADKFALLIQNLIERSTYIPDRNYQRKVFDLITEILDDFRLRLSQLIHDYTETWPFSQKFFSILNTFDFMLALINDLNLHSMLDDHQNGGKTVSNLSKTFQHMIDEIFARIIQVIISDFLFDLEEYRKLKWHGMSVDPENLELTKPAVKMFYNFSTKINLVKKFISKNLFNEFLFDVSDKIQDTLFENFFLKQNFNRDGILQLEYDIKHGLFAIFSSYIKNVQYTFAKISDCLLVLNLSPQTIRQLRHRDIDADMEFRIYLHTLGIYALTPVTVMELIERRIGFN